MQLDQGSKDRISGYNKWIVLITLLLLFPAVYGQFRVGIKGGLLFSNIQHSNDIGIKVKNGYRQGFFAGPELQIPVSNRLYLLTGLIYSIKGANDYNEIEGQKYSMSDIELPVQLALKFYAGNARVFAGAGLFFSYALSGFVEFRGGREELRFSNNLDEDDIFVRKRFNLGPEAIISYDFDFGIYIQLKAQIELVNQMPFIKGKTNPVTEKNFAYGLGAGYRF